MLAEPLVALNIVRSQLSLLAGIQSVKVRTHLQCILRLALIGSYQIISRGLILAGGRWRSQWICRRRLRITDDIGPLGRVLMSRLGLIRTDQIIPGGLMLFMLPVRRAYEIHIGVCATPNTWCLVSVRVLNRGGRTPCV